MGPRRVGKTVLLHHVVAALIAAGIPSRRICYISVDHPLYTLSGLSDLLDAYGSASGIDYRREDCFILFDEIQYLRQWEVHLKTLVDEYANLKIVASGSAAAALRLRSAESGAGRITDFLLPPLTFHEYLKLLNQDDLIQPTGIEHGYEWYDSANIAALNSRFLDYLNYGGYPEVALSREIQRDPARFIKSDIIDKVLLRDLPALYGIQDIPELNYLFTTLAFNTAGEISLEALSKRSGVAKNTIKRYIEYLEAAFLIKVVHRIDRNARRFQRANYFKVYLTNPSIRSALFAPVTETSQDVGSLAETAIFAQWFHSPQSSLHYARWQGGEVDIVFLGHQQKPAWAVEVKWSDRFVDAPGELRELLAFCRENGLERVTVTTKTIREERTVSGVMVNFVPASIYCYTVGRNLARHRQTIASAATTAKEPNST